MTVYSTETMSSGRFEDTEVLLKHADYILANLSFVDSSIKDEGPFMQLLKTREGQQMIKYVSDLMAIRISGGREPQVNKVITDLRDRIAPQIIGTVNILDYTVHWCKLVEDQLQAIARSTRDFDIRWNYPITKGCVELFNSYCKVVVYLHEMPNSLIGINVFGTSPIVNNNPLLSKFDELWGFVTESIKSPFELIERTMAPIGNKLAVLIFSHLPLFSQLFADFTFFDWKLLSVYETPPEETVGDSMPINELLVLSNLSMFQETIFFFSLCFSNYIEKNQQFRILGQSVLSESPLFYLSRYRSVQTQALINISPPKIKKYFYDLKKTSELKGKETHLNRMRQLILHATDLISLCQFDRNQFLRSIHQIRAISSFAYYEIDLFFRARGMNERDPENDKTISTLMFYLDKISRFFVNEKDWAERFFVFNLATTDAQYLDVLIKNFDLDLGAAGSEVVTASKKIYNALITVDIDRFDNGTRYDFFPMYMTIGRALHRYNQISIQLKASYLNSLFEHLNTIIMHAQAASSCVEFFLESCPLHTLWRHANSFKNFIDKAKAPPDYLVSFINVFSYFNYDNIILTMHKAEFDMVKRCIPMVKAALSSKLNSVLTKSLTKNYGYESNYGDYLLDEKNIYKAASTIQHLSRTNLLLSQLPNSIMFYGEQYEIAGYIIDRLSNELIKILILNVITNPSIITEATQLLWPYFNSTTQHFLKSLFEAIRKQTFFVSADLKEQTDVFFSPNPSNTTIDIIDKIQTNLNEFIYGKHKETRYVVFAQRFSGSNFSIQYFEDLFRVIGIHGALNVDSFIVKQIRNDLRLLTRFDQNGAPEALLRASVGLTLRDMVRKAYKTVINETFPGLSELISSNLPNVDDALLIKEICTDYPCDEFFSRPLANAMKGMNSNDFFIFLASLIDTPDWNDTVYFPDEDALSRNLHLIPRAFDVLINIAPDLFGISDFKKIEEGIDKFFEIVSKIIETKKQKHKQANSFLILIDKFPKMVSAIQYGRIETLFPYALLSLSYIQQGPVK